jgi:hypothetical protein
VMAGSNGHQWPWRFQGIQEGGNLNGEETEEIDGGSEAGASMRLDGGLKVEGDVGGARGGAARGTGGAAMGIGRLEVGDAPDRWVPPVGERERERRGGGALAGCCGPEEGKRATREEEKKGGGPGKSMGRRWVG